MNINTRLKELRKNMGINQEEAASRLGVSLSSYQKYEREKNSITPSVEVLVKIADLYSTSVDYLLGRDISEETDPLIVAIKGLSNQDKQTIITAAKAITAEVDLQDNVKSSTYNNDSDTHE